MRSERKAARGWSRALLVLALLGLIAIRFDAALPAGKAPATRVLGARLTGGGSSNSAPNAQRSDKDKPKQNFTISGSVGGLYPGAEEQLLLTVSNPNSFEIIVESLTIQVTGVDAGHSTCPTSNVEATDFSGALSVPKNGTATQTVPIRMIADADDACQGATFSLLYGGKAVKK